MQPPRVVVVTATNVVPVEALLRRLEAMAAAPLETRRNLAVMLRDPELSTRALLALGRRLREVTRALGSALVVNDRLDLARALDADGVHLGRRSVSVADARDYLGAHAWVSTSCHAPDEVARAARLGADAALLSPIFASPGKGAPLGLAALGEARRALGAARLRLWLVALGGVDAAGARACFEAGADGVAAIRADPAELTG